MNKLTKMAQEPFQTYINNFLATLESAGQSKQTIQTRRIQLVRLALALNVETCTEVELTNWIASQNWGKETRKSNRSAFQAFFNYLLHAHIREDDPACNLPPVRLSKPLPRPCPDKYVKAALEKADDEERVMIKMAAEYGLRRCEICRLHSDDVLEDHNGHYVLVVHGKGDKERTLPISDDIAAIISNAHGYVYPGRFGGHVEVSYVGKRLSHLLPDGWSGHTLRHRFATTAYCKTRDIYAVSQALGHESVATTQRYVALPADVLQDVVNAAKL